MIKKLILTASLLFTALQSEEAKEMAPSKELSQQEMNQLSEAFGHFIGKNLNAPGLNLNLDQVIKGIRDGFAGKPAPMSDEEYQMKMMALQQITFNKMAEQNLNDANAFLKKNAKESGIVEVETGKLQYKILQPGKGEIVKKGASPEINYTGKFIDDQVFGSSEQSGGPISVSLNQTIKGFSEGIVGMKEGEKRRLFIHPDLGYGTTGQLPPNSLLIFDIEIVKADTAPEQPMQDDIEEEVDVEEDVTSDKGDTGFNWPKW